MQSVYKQKYQKERVTTFAIAEKKIGFARGSTDALQKLYTTARPKINAADVKVPEGYSVEVFAAGLSLPTDLAVAPDGTLFISEGGSS